MASQRFFFLWLTAFVSLIVGSLGIVLPSPDLVGRDDNLPARVPYIFPAPGTNAVTSKL